MPSLRVSGRNTTLSRLRLYVVRALVISLFATLFARLYYVQVLSGRDYQAQAASQSLRHLVVQPPRGLIVDDQGRPLVANRRSWVVSVDRTSLDKMTTDERTALLRRVAKAVGQPLKTIQARSLLCGQAGAKAGSCWNGSAYQSIPVASDVRQQDAVQIQEQSERFPGVTVQTDPLRAYPAPYGVNAAGVLGYLSAITESELSKARTDGDPTLNAASVVGRAGLEASYDKYLRGIPGTTNVAVNAGGHVLGQTGSTPAVPGDTLVTSLDARLQAFVEKQLNQTMLNARKTYDKVTHKNYVADSAAAVVLDAHNGRVLALASEPTYKPSIWVGGISKKNLKRLYSKKADNPLLFRATQGQFAPGSTWKPEMTVGALNNGFDTNILLNCSSGVQVGNRLFKNYESESYGPITFAKALQISCDTFFYRVGMHFWQKYGSDPSNVNAKDPLVKIAKEFGYGKPTGIDIPGEAAGRVADRHWKLAYWKAMKGYYCKLDKSHKGSPWMRLFAHEFCIDGYQYSEGDAVNYAIGQGDTLVTPLQLARAYAAIANGGTLYEPRIARAIVSPDGKLVKNIKPVVAGHVDSRKAAFQYVDEALKGTPKTGTLAWKFIGFPLDQVQVRGKTGSAEVQGKQSTSLVATYTKDYVVVMMMTQAGTGSGTVGPAVRAIWESLYGVHGMAVKPSTSIIPGVTPPKGLPVFARDGSILPPATEGGSKQ